MMNKLVQVFIDSKYAKPISLNGIIRNVQKITCEVVVWNKSLKKEATEQIAGENTCNGVDGVDYWRFGFE